MRRIREIRRQFREIRKQVKAPLLICANHLTLIDSVIIHWAFSSIWSYFLHFRDFSWNVPEKDNFKNNLIRSVITYLGKCIPIERKGSKEHHDQVLNQMRYLLQQGEPFTIFPEGERSRTGRIDTDNVKYGVGNIIENVENCKVLCVYLRGDGQNTYSEIPKMGETFTLTMELLEPKKVSKGLRGQREVSYQIITKLKEMEDAYFAGRDQSGK